MDIMRGFGPRGPGSNPGEGIAGFEVAKDDRNPAPNLFWCGATPTKDTNLYVIIN